MNKKFYEIIYDCIASGQVSSDRIAKYLKDKGFYKYWKKRNALLQNDSKLFFVYRSYYYHSRMVYRFTVSYVV